MPKQGPCCHCGITSTPLWRNGPPGKPVLCNACGSRWRTKGTLANYAPLHCRTLIPVDAETRKNSHVHKSSSNTKTQSLQTNLHEGETEFEEVVPRNGSSAIFVEDDVSNRSSSASGLSFSECSVLLGSMDGIDISGSVHSHVWETQVPSRKRTNNRCSSPSPVEKLRRDLYDILQEQESTNLSGFSEEVLVFQRNNQMLSLETDLGSVLIRHPAILVEEESEASSRVMGSKVHSLNDTLSGSSVFVVSPQSLEVSSNGRLRVLSDIEERDELKDHPVKRRALADISSGNILLSKVDILENSQSPQRSKVLKTIGGPALLPTKIPLVQPLYQTSGVVKGSAKAQNCASTNHPVQASSSKNKACRKGLVPLDLKDPMQVEQPHLNGSLSTSSLSIPSSDASCPAIRLMY